MNFEIKEDYIHNTLRYKKRMDNKYAHSFFILQFAIKKALR